MEEIKDTIRTVCINKRNRGISPASANLIEVQRLTNEPTADILKAMRELCLSGEMKGHLTINKTPMVCIRKATYNKHV